MPGLPRLFSCSCRAECEQRRGTPISPSSSGRDASVATSQRLDRRTSPSFLSLSTDEGTPGPVFGGVDLENVTFFSTVAAFYRVLETEDHMLDVLAGVRVWYVDTELRFEPGLSPGFRVRDDEAWVDPVIGMRGALRLLGPVFLSAGADLGGATASDSTWQVLGTLDWRPGSWLSLRAGYRHLEVDYERGGFVFDVAMSGPIIGGEIRF